MDCEFTFIFDLYIKHDSYHSLEATDVNGNISTCNTQVTVTGSGSRPGSSPFTVNVAPNPSTYQFTLKFNNTSNENMKLSVTDVSGRVIEQKQSIPANSTLQLGHGYHPGIYFVEIIQGTQKLKLIKAGN